MSFLLSSIIEKQVVQVSVPITGQTFANIYLAIFVRDLDFVVFVLLYPRQMESGTCINMPYECLFYLVQSYGLRLPRTKDLLPSNGVKLPAISSFSV